MTRNFECDAAGVPIKEENGENIISSIVDTFASGQLSGAVVSTVV